MIVAKTLEEAARALAGGKGAAAHVPVVATIGNFDGVHIGHQALLRRTMARARELGGSALVITFEPHPGGVLSGTPPQALTNTAQKLECFAALRLDVALVLPFTPALAARSTEDFCRDVLAALGVTELLVGYDFRMGRDQAGAEDLAACGAERGFTVMPLPAVKLNGMPVSSSAIRKALEDGMLTLANVMLGRSYAVRSAVVRGAGRGGPLLGIPTANMAPEGFVLPKPAVYATTARLSDVEYGAREGVARPMLSVSSFGRNPTFGQGELVLETHILDFSDDLYGKELEVTFEKALRPEKTFDGPEELKQQIERDIAVRRQLGKSEDEILLDARAAMGIRCPA